MMLYIISESVKGTGTSQADSLRKHRAFGRSAGERRQIRFFCLTGFTASHNQSFILRNPAISCALTQSIIQMMDYIYCIYCMLCYKEYCMQISNVWIALIWRAQKYSYS